jgi:hypothetical protein
MTGNLSTENLEREVWKVKKSSRKGARKVLETSSSVCKNSFTTSASTSIHHPQVPRVTSINC